MVPRSAVLLSLFLLTACPGTGDEPIDDPLGWAVDEPGPYRVGHREWEVRYSPEAYDGERTINVHVWYPTNARQGIASVYEVVFQDPDSFLDAGFAAVPGYEGGLPVHVYSHGHQGFAGSTSYLMRYFASHGWVVVAPDHIGNTLSTNIDPRPTDTFHVRSQDITRTLDELDNLPESDPLFGCCDTGKAVLSGHSYGTFTNWASMGATFDMASIDALCDPAEELFDCDQADKDMFAAGLGDERFVAAIPMAGTIRRNFLGATGHESVHGPMFAMTGTDDPVGQQQQWDETDNIEFSWIDIEGGCHQTFGVGACNNISDEESFPIVQTYALAFARRHLLGDEDATVAGILDGTIEVSPLVSFQKK